MLKAMVENSVLSPFINSYEYSKTKKFIKTMGGYYNESALVKGINKFAEKTPATKYSVYQRSIDKLNVSLSPIFKAVHDFFAAMINDSKASLLFFGFLQNKTENKIRAASVFIFYFLLGISMLSVFGKIFRGHATIFFVASLVFLWAAVFCRQLTAAFENSFFVKIFKGLIK